jgi:hypothetical protein
LKGKATFDGKNGKIRNFFHFHHILKYFYAVTYKKVKSKGLRKTPFSVDIKSRDVTTLGEQLCFTYRGGTKSKEHLYEYYI